MLDGILATVNEITRQHVRPAARTYIYIYVYIYLSLRPSLSSLLRIYSYPERHSASYSAANDQTLEREASRELLKLRWLRPGPVASAACPLLLHARPSASHRPCNLPTVIEQRARTPLTVFRPRPTIELADRPCSSHHRASRASQRDHSVATAARAPARYTPRRRNRF